MTNTKNIITNTNTNTKDIIIKTLNARKANFPANAQALIDKLIEHINSTPVTLDKPFTVILSIRGDYKFMGYKTIPVAVADTCEEALNIYTELSNEYESICNYKSHLHFSFATTRALTQSSSVVSKLAYSSR